jgi:hypothetical protein
LLIVYDRLQACQESTFEYWLHANEKFVVENQHAIRVQAEGVVCDVDILCPPALAITQTNDYDPNPWPQITTREWHLTATTPQKQPCVEFVALYRPRKADEAVPKKAKLERRSGELVLHADLSDGKIIALLPTAAGKTLHVQRLDPQGGPVVTVQGKR